MPRGECGANDGGEPAPAVENRAGTAPNRGSDFAQEASVGGPVDISPGLPDPLKTGEPDRLRFGNSAQLP
jgi:hypothetical protein